MEFKKIKGECVNIKAEYKEALERTEKVCKADALKKTDEAVKKAKK